MASYRYLQLAMSSTGLTVAINSRISTSYQRMNQDIFTLQYPTCLSIGFMSSAFIWGKNYVKWKNFRI